MADTIRARHALLMVPIPLNHARQAYGPGGLYPVAGDHTLLAEQRRE